MEQITIKIRDESKARLLLEFLTSLDFVEAVQQEKIDTPTPEHSDDFFALAGLWQNRTIDADTLRQRAWPHQI